MKVIFLIPLIYVAGAVAEPATSEAELEELKRLVRQQQEMISDLQQRLEVLEQQDAVPPESAPAALPPSAAEPSPLPEGAVPLQTYWSDGLQFRSEDGAFEMQIGGRLQLDIAWFDESEDFKTIGGFFPAFGLNDEDDGAEFRRARLSVTGRAFTNVIFKAEFDFAADIPGDNSGQFREVWVGLDAVPYLGSVRAGNFKEPFSLEEFTTDNATTFMERGLPNVFAPSYNTGIMFQRSFLDKRLTWSAGVFKTTDDWPSDGDSDEDQGYAVTTRLTGLPWYADEGRRLLHLGASYSHRNPDGMMRFRQRPESHLANFYVNTGMFRVDDLDLYGAEGALVYGPLSVQGEYILSEADTTFGGDRSFNGYYVYASYFLTGENRPYSMGSATFGVPSPRNNFRFREGGWGAWELGLRYSALDLDDGPVRGGRLEDYTLGLNWYLNPHARIMLNYVIGDVEHDLYEGDFQALQTRFQVNF